MPQRLQEEFALGGGLNEKAPLSMMKPGELIACLNAECKQAGGYRRIDGYEKFDTNAVTGEGDILGVWQYNGKVYAFRNAVGGATAVMWESTGSGWTSKKTGLAPDGEYRFVNANFDGTEKMYGVSGTHKAFQWDGTTWTDLTTGLSTDTPSHILSHKNHLFVSYLSSILYSATGDPTDWTVPNGAGEIRVDGDVTGLTPIVGGALMIATKNSIEILNGSGNSDWKKDNLAEHGNMAGARDGTVQLVGTQALFIDDSGVTTLSATDKFGDFVDAQVSFNIEDRIKAKIDAITCTTVIRGKSQYRIFFSDGTGLICSTFNGQVIGITPIEFPLVVKTASRTEDSDGIEQILFGSNDGYVYLMDSGNSFDGTRIVSYFRTAYHDYRIRNQLKRFRRVVLGVGSTGNTGLQVKADAIYADTVKIDRPYQDVTALGFGSLLGTGVLGSFILGSSLASEGRAPLDAHGDYLSIQVYNENSDDDVTFTSPWEIDTILVTYSPRKKRRI